MKRLAFALLLTAGCASAPPSVKVSSLWPETAISYDSAYERWTRRATKSQDLGQIIDAEATLLTPEWRAAWLKERARRERIPADALAKLTTAEQDATANAWQVELIVATPKSDWNDFHKGVKSMWQLALIGDDGRAVVPSSVAEDKRPRPNLHEWFPLMGTFHRTYLVTFPKVAGDGKPLVHEGSPRMSMTIGSAVASVELVWSETPTGP